MHVNIAFSHYVLTDDGQFLLFKNLKFLKKFRVGMFLLFTCFVALFCRDNRLFPLLNPDSLASEILKSVESRKETLVLPIGIRFLRMLYSVLPERVVAWIDNDANDATRALRKLKHFSTLDYLNK